MGNDDAGVIRVELAYSPRPGEVLRLTLTLPLGATVADALARSGWVLPEDLKIAVWSRPRTPADVLRDGDRIELCRPLKVDPKEARRQRYRSHREKKP